MRKVMLVENEELILQGIRNILDWESLGLEVVHMAHDGQEALEMWDREPVHIVVTDISMPVMDGLTLLRKIREKEEQVRFIILTGYDEFEYAREAIRLEVENYILKPVNEEELERQLLETLEKLEEMEKKKISYIDEKNRWMHFLNGKSEKKEESLEYARFLGLPVKREAFYAALMKWKMDGLKENMITDAVMELQKMDICLKIVHLPPDSLLMVCAGAGMDEDGVMNYFSDIQNKLESSFHVRTFIGIGPCFQSFDQLPKAYRRQKNCRNT